MRVYVKPKHCMESITSPGPVCLLHSQFWSWHTGIALNFLLAVQPSRFFLPAPLLRIKTFSYLLFAESDLSKKEVWGFPGGNTFLCYKIKICEKHKARTFFFCQGKSVAYSVSRRRCCCCCCWCCSTLPVGCRVDLVWVTLIETVCSS